MKFFKNLICAALAAVTTLSGVPAFAADAGQTAAIHRDSPVVEGNRAYCWNEAGKQTFYLEYNKEVYAPLRTVAEWMGKDLTKDAGGKVFTLSGSKTPLFRDQAYPDKGEKNIYSDLSSDAYLAKMEEPVPVTLLGDVRILVDGKAIAVTAADGKSAKPLSWSGDVYIPLGTAAKMMNMEIKYTERTPVSNGMELPKIESIYIHTKLTDAELAACKTYADAVKKVFDEYDTKVLNPDVSTMEAASAAVQKCIGYMNTLKQIPKPDVRMLDREYTEMIADADEALKGFQTVAQMIQNKEDLKKVQFAILTDWQLKGYPEYSLDFYQERMTVLGVSAVHHALYIYNYVYER